MKLKIATIFILFTSLFVFSQKGTDVLFTVDETPVYVSEFKRVYEKNRHILSEDNKKGVENYLNLFVNYQLKLKEAYLLRLDTTRAYKREIETYRNQLIAPYLQDSTFLTKLVKEAYYRTKYKVNASHVLIKVPKDATPADTLAAYKKIEKARAEVLSGTPFDKVALLYSEDESVKSNLGNLGYFTAFKMVYAFENEVYTTKVDEVSKPFKTSFGYHFVKVHDLQLFEGEVEVAHILLTDSSPKGKTKIDSIYNALKSGADFEKMVLKYSNDNSTTSNGGKLPKFGIGRMLKSFEDQAYTLKNIDELSMPFQTQFGWHIVKLLKRYPIGSFEEMKNELLQKVRESGGANLSDLAVLRRLKKEYQISTNEKAKAIFSLYNIRAASIDTLQQAILTINKKEIKQELFFDYIRNRRHKPIEVLFDDFLNEEVLTYFKENLRFTEPEFAATLKEFEEGLVVFELMQQKIWDKSSKGTLGLQAFFNANLKKYDFKELSKNKGQVMNDFQTYLEEELNKNLMQKYKVVIRKKVVKELVKQYQIHE
jgi:peptidyl-prolyl cis-trans isomerase SurA